MMASQCSFSKKRIKISVPDQYKKSSSSESLGDRDAKPADTPLLLDTTSGSLPSLSLSKLDDVSFPVNEECTALKFSPSGRLVVAGFADGTVRLFDLTGKYTKSEKRLNITSSSSEETTLGSSRQSGKMVLSKDHQLFGAVACQIHAKGVHTVMLMDVDISEDCQWCFAGVLRGSMELVAVHLGHLEDSYNDPEIRNDLLDLVQVYRKADAKLRGFGACTRLKDKYLLFTGKAIKNIHIWSFQPPKPGTEPVWQQLYDTSTNGNTIKLLQFRRNRNGLLQGISKSDGQKLRVWDLSHEDLTDSVSKRPVRPPFKDVTNTESTLSVAGGFCICGGSFNQMSIVSLDDNLQSPYNRTELALPGVSATATSSRRRQQRGDLKCIENVAGMVTDAGQVLLELSDRSTIKYTQNSSGLPVLEKLDVEIPPEGVWRQMTVCRVGAEGIAVAAFAVYNPALGQGCIKLTVLDAEIHGNRSGYWGFAGRPTLPRPLSVRQETKLTCYAESDYESLVTNSSKTSPNDHSTEVALNVVTTAKKTVPSVPYATNQIPALGMTMVTPKTSDTPFGKTTKAPPASSPLARRLAATTPFTKPARVSLGDSYLVASTKDSPDSVTPVPRNAERMVRKTNNEKRGTEATAKGKPKNKREVGSSATGIRGIPTARKQSLGLESATATKYVKTIDGTKKVAMLSATGVEPNKRKVKTKNGFGSVPRVRSIENHKENLRSAQPKGPSPSFPRKRMNINGPSGLRDYVSKHGAETMNLVPNASYKAGGTLGPLSPEPIRSSAVKDQSLTRKLILESCATKLDEIQGLLDELTRTSIWERKGTSVPANLLERHAVAQSHLAAEHRAAHEFLRKQILHETRNTVWSVQSSPRLSSIDKAKVFLRDTLEGYQHKLEQMVCRQEIEASTLQAMQTRERDGDEASLLEVSFTFPTIFEQAMGCLPQMD